MARISWVFHEHPVLIVARLGVERNDLQVELWQINAEVAGFLEYLSCIRSNPVAPGFSNTVVELDRIALAPFVDVHRITFVVAKRGHHRSSYLLLHEFSKDHREVEVVRLRLLPNVVGSVVTGPQNQINVFLADVL